jgi:FkbM family methyltransferase
MIEPVPIGAFMNVIPLIARCTRWLQARVPHRSIKGLTRFGNVFRRWSYQGVVRFEDGIRMFLNNHQSSERWLLFSGNYHVPVTNLLQKFTPRGGYCLDVGANLGFYTLKLAQWVGIDGTVTAFEANPAMVERIKKNVSLNNMPHVDVVQAAVHNEPGELEFYVSDSPGKSSIYAIANPREKIVVKAITLDDYLKEWPRLDVIKMDIEGNDCLGLYGGRESIRRFRPFIIFEYNYTTLPRQAKQLFELLEDLNYDIQTLGDMGQLFPFDWQTAKGRGHVDVVCQPRS